MSHKLGLKAEKELAITLALSEEQATLTDSYPYQNWNIWVEGYQATGQHSPARLVADAVSARTFREAVLLYITQRIKDNPHDGDVDYFDPKRLSYWGCRYFDNETDARKFCG